MSVTRRPTKSNFGVNSVRFSPDSQFLAACCGDSVVRIWDARSGQPLEYLEGHQDDVHSIAFTPDGHGLVSGSWDNTVKYWDLSRLFTKTLESTAGENDIAPGQEDEEKSRCVMTLEGHAGGVLAVAVSHDGRWIVSGSEDCGVRFWDVKTGEMVCLLHGHDQWGTWHRSQLRLRLDTEIDAPI